MYTKAPNFFCASVSNQGEQHKEVLGGFWFGVSFFFTPVNQFLVGIYGLAKYKILSVQATCKEVLEVCLSLISSEGSS